MCILQTGRIGCVPFGVTAFYDGDSQYNEFSIEAEVHYNSSDSAWVVSNCFFIHCPGNQNEAILPTFVSGRTLICRVLHS